MPDKYKFHSTITMVIHLLVRAVMDAIPVSSGPSLHINLGFLHMDVHPIKSSSNQ